MQKFTLSLVALFVLSIGALGQSANALTGLTGLKANVTVRRDARWIPYIEAGSDADAYFAQGYVTASDRLFQMDLLRRLALGETAELFGKTTLEEDKRWRRFGFARIADESFQHLSPELKAALESYAKGVNAYISSLTDANMPVEFRLLQYKPREWRAADAIVIGNVLRDALSTTWRNDLLRASVQSLPKEKFDELTESTTPYDVILFGTDAKKPPARAWNRWENRDIGSALQLADKDETLRRTSLERVGLYAEELAASNNWVVSGKHTVDGKPILANDPHLRPSAPSIWYMTSLQTPSMRVAGVTVPGLPGIILGHNEHIAWGATNVGPDVQDLFIETFNEKGEYKTPAGWTKAAVRTETIRVRPNPFSPATETVTLDVTSTRNGPIIVEQDGKKYALKWTAFDPKNIDFETFYGLNRAKDWTSFKMALSKYGGSAQNFIYADVKGNIGWYAASRIPIRRQGDGSFPYDGATNEGDWVGNIPFGELPNLYNPASGLIVTANQRIVGTSYKYTQMSRDAAAPWRARRIHDLLEAAKGRITQKLVGDVQYDILNLPLQALARKIVGTKAASPDTIAALSGWDGRMQYQSTAAMITNEIRNCLASRIADENKPAPMFIIRERILYRGVDSGFGKWLPSGFKSDEEFYRHCDTRTREALTSRLGADASKWTWGNSSKAIFPHPLEVAPLVGAQFKVPQVPIDGSGQTPHVASGVSMRFITTPGNWDATSLLVPVGQSGDPRSPHYMDQFSGWAMGYGGEFPFSRDAVAKATQSTLVLKP
jgi:penicillin G amidase